jgi:hypothetical protein
VKEKDKPEFGATEINFMEEQQHTFGWSRKEKTYY